MKGAGGTLEDLAALFVLNDSFVCIFDNLVSQIYLLLYLKLVRN